VIGAGTEVPTDLEDAPYRFMLVEPWYKGRPLAPKWGRETVWYPVRVLINRTVAPWRRRRWNAEFVNDSPYIPFISRPDIESMGVAQNPAIVHCHDLDTLWAGWRIAQRCGSVLIYDSHELYLELEYLPEERRRQFAQIEARVFPLVDAFITVSPEIADALIQKYQSTITPVILYNGGTHVVASTKPVSKPVKLFFQGKFASNRNNVELICAMQHLHGRATLTLQGWGPDEKNYRNVIVQSGLENVVTILPPVPISQVVDSANDYDVGVINIPPLSEHLTHTLPNKLFDYMCGGLAVASTSLAAIKGVIDEAGCGITYESESVDSTAHALEKLVSDPARIQSMKEASLAAAPRYAWPAQEKKLIALYKELAKKVQEESCRRAREH